MLNWQQIICNKVEQEYRDGFLREDISMMRFVLIVAVLWAAGYFYLEYLDLGFTALFFLLVSIRLVFISASILFYRKLPGLNHINTIDFNVLIWSIALIFMAFLSTFCRQRLSLNTVQMSFLWILAFYLLVPNRLLLKLIPAFFVSVVSAYILFNYKALGIPEIPTSAQMTTFMTVLVINVVGFLVSAKFESQRYRQYLLQKTLIDGRADLKRLAGTDSLTGIPNRRSFLETADIQFDRYKRYEENFAFVIMDIDKLKQINDTFGHPAGDYAIQLLTETISAQKRSSDTVGRLAGDEFGIILPNTGATEAIEVLSRIRNALAEAVVEAINKQQFQVSFSAGVTEAKKTDENFDDLYKRADKALLVAKNLGRNRIEIG